jgi:hypothetical protein
MQAFFFSANEVFAVAVYLPYDSIGFSTVKIFGWFVDYSSALVFWNITFSQADKEAISTIGHIWFTFPFMLAIFLEYLLER